MDGKHSSLLLEEEKPSSDVKTAVDPLDDRIVRIQNGLKKADRWFAGERQYWRPWLVNKCPAIFPVSVSTIIALRAAFCQPEWLGLIISAVSSAFVNWYIMQRFGIRKTFQAYIKALDICMKMGRWQKRASLIFMLMLQPCVYLSMISQGELASEKEFKKLAGTPYKVITFTAGAIGNLLVRTIAPAATINLLDGYRTGFKNSRSWCEYFFGAAEHGILKRLVYTLSWMNTLFHTGYGFSVILTMMYALKFLNGLNNIGANICPESGCEDASAFFQFLGIMGAIPSALSFFITSADAVWNTFAYCEQRMQYCAFHQENKWWTGFKLLVTLGANAFFAYASVLGLASSRGEAKTWALVVWYFWFVNYLSPHNQFWDEVKEDYDHLQVASEKTPGCITRLLQWWQGSSSTQIQNAADEQKPRGCFTRLFNWWYGSPSSDRSTVYESMRMDP